MSECTVSFIGCGNIASAIMSGIISQGYIKPCNIYGYDVDISRKNIVENLGANFAGDVFEATQCDYVFLTIKPQVCAKVLPELFGKIKGCVISVVAGLKIEKITALLGDLPIIRVMPNTPIMVNSGAAGICKNHLVSDAMFDYAKGIFNACGVCCSVDEAQMDAVTALSGSGPAYVFRFAKAMCEQATCLGLSEQDALTLACATLRGGADMLQNAGMTADELIKMVSSPNGTTVAGLSKLDALGFDNAVKECVKAAHDRSKELS
ncbi:MAG: pyrroline-5-carboxylate reductase [Clostridia bacterium]|nr:pyrroline-5-carboxylate reductase [Clostridia bacterium]